MKKGISLGEQRYNSIKVRNQTMKNKTVKGERVQVPTAASDSEMIDILISMGINVNSKMKKAQVIKVLNNGVEADIEESETDESGN